MEKFKIMDATKLNLKTCCAKYIRWIWVNHGPDVLHWDGNCPSCGQLIGLTGTTRAEANNFLRAHGLKPLPIAREEIQREQKEIADWFEEGMDMADAREDNESFFLLIAILVGVLLAIAAFVKLVTTLA